MEEFYELTNSENVAFVQMLKQSVISELKNEGLLTDKEYYRLLNRLPTSHNNCVVGGRVLAV